MKWKQKADISNYSYFLFLHLQLMINIKNNYLASKGFIFSFL